MDAIGWQNFVDCLFYILQQWTHVLCTFILIYFLGMHIDIIPLHHCINDMVLYDCDASWRISF